MSIPRFLILGNLASGKSTFAGTLAGVTGYPHTGIDQLRRACSDGSPAGEALAWAKLLEIAQSPGALLLECTGGGPFVHLLRLALQRSDEPWEVVRVQTPVATCLARATTRGFRVPYPDFGVPLAQVIAAVEAELGRLIGTHWPLPCHLVDGTAAPALEVSRFLARVGPP